TVLDPHISINVKPSRRLRGADTDVSVFLNGQTASRNAASIDLERTVLAERGYRSAFLICLNAQSRAAGIDHLQGILRSGRSDTDLRSAFGTVDACDASKHDSIGDIDLRKVSDRRRIGKTFSGVRS